jgi:Reversibly glycosylated polypeptide
MGFESNGLDRFDDIWSGLILKRVIDYMGWYVTTGEPFVKHQRQSNPFLNLRREALGIQIHERLWDYILDTPLEPGLGVTGAFLGIAERLRRFPELSSDVPCPPGYFQRVADAMHVWSELFECSGESRSDARQ